MSRFHIVLLAIVAALLPVAFPWLGFVFTLAVAKGLAALGVAILLRAGLISIGHALYIALGAYATAFMMRHAHIAELAVLLFLATLVAALAGALVGLFMMRYRAIFFAMLNLAVSMVFFTLLAKLYHLTGGTDGMRVATPTVLGLQLDRSTFDAVLLGTALVCMVGAALLVERYYKSPLGEALRAVHTNEVRLEYVGVSAQRVVLLGYVVSAALAGLGGALSALAIGHVVPEMSYWTASGHLVLIAVLGGVAGVPGAFIGALFLELVRSFAVGFAADAWNAIIGVSLLAVIFFLPDGLYGLLMRRKQRGARA